MGPVCAPGVVDLFQNGQDLARGHGAQAFVLVAGAAAQDEPVGGLDLGQRRRFAFGGGRRRGGGGRVGFLPRGIGGKIFARVQFAPVAPDPEPAGETGKNE